MSVPTNTHTSVSITAQLVLPAVHGMDHKIAVSLPTPFAVQVNVCGENWSHDMQPDSVLIKAGSGVCSEPLLTSD
jgi:hypothetical protein